MPGVGQRVGYVRVSTLDQRVDRQLEGLHVDRVFTDYASGKDANRPALQEMLAYVREGDTIVVASMDRLARNLDSLRSLVSTLTKRGISIEFVKENLIFSTDATPLANLLLSVLGAVAQFERELIRERQREGIQLAKKRGVYRGRKRALSADQAAELRQRAEQGTPKATLAKEFHISRETVYQYLRPHRNGVASLIAVQP